MKKIKIFYKLALTIMLVALWTTKFRSESNYYSSHFQEVADQAFKIIEQTHPTLKRSLSGESNISYNGYFSHLIFSSILQLKTNRIEAFEFLDQFYEIFFDLCSKNNYTKEYIKKFGLSNKNILITFYFEQENEEPVYNPYVGILRADCGHDIIHCFDPVTRSFDCEVKIHQTIDAKAFL